MTETPDVMGQDSTPEVLGQDSTPEVPGQDSTSEVRSERVTSRRGRRLLVAIIIILLLALVGISVLLAGLVMPRGGVATQDEAGDITWVRSIYGWGDEPDEQFQIPRKADVGADGTIWVTDATRPIAFAFNPEGQYVGEAGSQVPTSAPMITPGPVAAGPENRTFIGEREMDRIRVFSEDGPLLGQIPIPSPTDIDYTNETLVVGSIAGFAVLDPETGNPIRVVGTRGTGPEQFDTVGGVTTGPDGTQYAVDTFNNRLTATDEDGIRIWTTQTGHPGNDVAVTGATDMQASKTTTAPAALQLPADLCLDANGHILVVDSFDFSIAQFDMETGEFLRKFGAYGTADGQLRYPTSISYDRARDWFVIADSGNARVQIVRIPESAPFDLGAAARRTLSGPLRACLAPLFLLLVMLVVFIVRRVRRRRSRSADAVPYDQAQDPTVESASGASDGTSVADEQT